MTTQPTAAPATPDRLPFNSLPLGTAFRLIDQDGTATKEIYVALETFGSGKIASHTSPPLGNAVRQSLFCFKDEENPMDALVEVVPLALTDGTLSSRWAQDKQTDPHAGHYDKERASLSLGSLTDDELANGAFLNYDRPLPIPDMVHPKPGQHMPIVWMTAVKDRIRWLSRSLDKALAQQAAPSPESVWLTLLDIMHSDNGGPFMSSTDDFREARTALVALIEAGFFHDDSSSLDSDYWLAAAGEETEAARRFKPAAFIDLNNVLNRIFNRAQPDLVSLQTEVDRLNAIINTPHLNDFLKAVSIEAEHQRQRWGADHDVGKLTGDWLFLLGHLGSRAVEYDKQGNSDKYLHHIITSAAACMNWHLAAKGMTNMRPGINPGEKFDPAATAEPQG